MAETHPWLDPESGEIVVDYCIIGGGVSGLYSAVRLSQVQGAEEPPRICILEATRRVGGRIATVKVPKTSHLADLGAMRFIPTQPLIASIVRNYGLETYNYDFPTDFYFVRGRRLSPRGAGLVPLSIAPEKETAQPLYHSLRKKEIGKEPAHLVLHAIARALEEVKVYEPYASAAADLEDAQILTNRLDGCYERVISDGFRAFTPKQWRTIKLLGHYPTANGLYLYQLGFWDVVQSQLSSEAYSFVDEGLGYQTIVGTWNAADAIPWFLADFAGVPYQSIRGGMGQLPRQLYDSFIGAMKRRRDLSPFNDTLVVLKNATVGKVCSRDSDSSILIDAAIAVPGGLSAPIQFRASHCLVCVSKGAISGMQFAATARDGKEVDLKKRTVLRANSAVAGVDGTSAARERIGLIGKIVGQYSDDPNKYSFAWLLECVEPQPLLKMFLAFAQSWWEKARQRADEGDAEDQGFKVFTNLPLRQLYYHLPKSNGGTTGNEEGSGDGMVMAYCDAKHASYWDALALQESAKYGADEEHSVEEKRDLEDYGVSRHLAERAHEQIWRVHRGLVTIDDLPASIIGTSDFTPRDDHGNRERIALSKKVLFMNWMRPPFHGGWHAWRIGIVSDDVKKIWENPWMGVRIYFAGEVMSSDQGWTEGALRAAERVLVHQLDRPAPTWGGGVGAGREDVNTKAKFLGFRGIEEYVKW